MAFGSCGAGIEWSDPRVFVASSPAVLHDGFICSPTSIGFVERSLNGADVEGRSVLEVGSRDVNGSAGPYVRSLAPSTYVGVDIEDGHGVDEICDAGQLVERFGADSFDVVLSTELVEHVRDWQRVILNLKTVLSPSGTIVVTTRSPGFYYHGYPHDFWRYTTDDMRLIFGDFDDVHVEPDTIAPGVFLRARKPAAWQPMCPRVELHSVVTNGRTREVTSLQIALFKLRYTAHGTVRRTLPETVRAPLRRLVRR